MEGNLRLESAFVQGGAVGQAIDPLRAKAHVPLNATISMDKPT
jgi:hypothetical protein